jgi:myo-inositol 2-dehydrogenase/D-chiro-inositol 1-dehydrogenase
LSRAPVSVGVIGTGAMGATHVRTLAFGVEAARVAAVADVDLERATAVAGEVGTSRVHADAHDLIADASVEAVLVASPAATHEELVLACLDAGKPVLCEKPLAVTVEACRRIVEVEAALGRELVQVGFMRRYDPAYLDLKRELDAGQVGDPLLLHCVHRNADVPHPFGSEAALTESVVHDVDVARWLLGREITSVTVLAPRATRQAPPGVRDPQLVLLEADGGVLVDVESFLRARYGYDVRCEVVGESGVLALAPRAPVGLRRDGRESVAVPGGFESRFAQAYRDELEAWVEGLRAGAPAGPTAWDGYAAGAVTDACLQSLASGRRTEVRLAPRPGLYRGSG